MFKLSNNSIKHRAGVDWRLIDISNRAIEITLVDFGHDRTAGLRTVAQQNRLFFEKKSKADGINNMSKHQTGRALDFYAYVDGKVSYEPEHLAMVACAFLQAASLLGYKISWGGLWAKKTGFYGWDMPHIQLEEE